VIALTYAAEPATRERNKLTRNEAIAVLTASGQPYAVETAIVRGQPVRTFRSAPPSLRALYEGTLSDKPFLVYEDERMSFKEAWQASSRIAAILMDQFGVAKGDRVAISMRNYPEWILSFVAITSVGAIAVAMNALWQSDEMDFGLKDSGATVLIADQERLDRFALCSSRNAVRAIAVRPTRDNGVVPELRALENSKGPAAMPQADIASDDPVTMIYTSGTTAQPKGVVSTNRAILNTLLSWELDERIGALLTGVESPQLSSPGVLLGIPLFHVTGSHTVYLHSYRAQRKIVCMYKWDPERAAELVAQERITHFAATPAMTGDLARIAKKTNHDVGSLVWVGGGGAHRAPDQVRQIDSNFPNAVPGTGWGMTETNAVGVGIGGQDYLDHPASAGRCSAVLDIKIVDNGGRAAPAGSRGELCVRGGTMFSGYWNRNDLNAESFADGWFHTGDIAYLDDGGYLYIVDRIKDMIIRGGENIGCVQVEDALMTHPGVHEAAVYAIPDGRLGEEVGATVFGDLSLDQQALRDYLIARLARFKVPRYITISAEPLPRIASGKIFKRQLREEATARIAARGEVA
jgi:long-chain acyl-CoA synthetase